MLASLQTALITGASMGIGEAFARHLASRGFSLVLVARSENKLHELAGQLAAQHGIKSRVVVADLAQSRSAAQVLSKTQALGLDIDLLVNNAGFARIGSVAELPFDEQVEMLHLNVNTLTELSRLYLPAMCQRGRGGIINVASNAAFQPVPYMAVYAASKAYVLSFTEAMAEEVAEQGVTVMALCPGATATRFWITAGAWEDKAETMASADDLVAQALQAFDRRQRVFIHGGLNKVATWASRLGPRRFVVSAAGRTMKQHR